jgi:3-hydroxybutyryl-CoA dehydrogenase
MGTGIAQVLVSAGVDVLIVDRDADALQKASEVVRVRSGRKPSAGTISSSASMAGFASVELVVEAVTEDLEAKRSVLAELDRVCPPGVLLATNTSSLSVGAIASATSHPERVVGMHFMNPAPVMKLVEVVRAEKSSEQSVLFAQAIVRQIGKTPVLVADAPCFIVNRLLMPLINEAARLVARGVASAEAVDSAMKLGANFPMGPLHVADLIGLDIVVEELRVLEAHGGSAFEPSTELTERVRNGRFGRKSGAGFFEYGPALAKK